MKGQQAQIELLEAKITEYEESSFKKSLLAMVNKSSKTDQNILFQNNPNPFSESTSIRFDLTEDVEAAVLYIFDMSGKQVQNYIITEMTEKDLNNWIMYHEIH